LTTMESGGGFDPCECLFSHEAAMGRLLNLLRNNQNMCTDNDCNDATLGSGQGSSALGANTTMLSVVMIWVVLAIALFMYRPASQRQDSSEKRSGNDRDANGPPPAPLL
ncbi:Small integral membrane protein 14, partial [Trichinella spiralis]